MSRVLTNPYELLEVPTDAGADEIKAAYRKLALRYHPDRNPGDKDAEERFKEISEAYAVLRDPDARARFDRYGSAPQGDPRGYQPDFTSVDWQTIFNEADIHIDWSARGGVPPRTGNAVFDTLFGMVTGMFRNAGLLPGETREITVRIPYALARVGGTRNVKVPGPITCPTCHGSRTVDGRTCPDCGGSGVRNIRSDVEVRVPAGVKPGTRLRLRGMGGPGNPPGDLHVRLDVALPEGARLEGDDLHAALFLTPWELSNGVDTVFEGVPVHVKAGTSAGQTIRVAGGGLGIGDLVLAVRSDVWRGLMRTATTWFRGIAEGRAGT